MTHPFLHLPDEILLIIMSKISNIDVLHSLMGTCEKLDRLACDLVHTRSIDLTETTSNDQIRPLSDEMLDRFCENILPRIHQNIECLTAESSSIHRIFQSIEYPKLFKLILPELDLESVSQYFNGKHSSLSEIQSMLFLEQTSFIRICNEQIFHAVLTVMDKSESASLSDVAMHLYLPIFNLLKSVTYLDFVIKDSFRYPPLSLDDFPPNACFSSTIVHLSIKVMDLEDCLSLLDGRLNRLHTFIVEIHHICPSTNDLANTVKPI